MESLKSLIPVMLPEIILVAAACALFLLGMSVKAAARRAAPWVAVAALALAFLAVYRAGAPDTPATDDFATFRVWHFTQFVKMMVAAIGVLLTLLAWPSNRDATGNTALHFGGEAGEFFGLMLLSLSGLLMVAGANDMMTLFLGIELASIPTYIMVSVSRPIAAAQEAGVKYFFLGAMAAALMLFGFSYLYGTTGTSDLNVIASMMYRTAAEPGIGTTQPSGWQIFAVLMIVGGLAFKMAAVPLHFYAGDVYHGAATPVTAFLSFVPKATGVIALVKIIWVYGGGETFAVPETLAKLLWWMAVLTMTAGNLLGLLQANVKRLLAYSSIAHSGYLLVGLTALAYATGHPQVHNSSLQAVLFYLTAYGVMNVGIFAVLLMLPSREPRIATSAETFEDLAGQGRKHPVLGLATAAACFSLIGLPLTVGFLGKLYLIAPALQLARMDEARQSAMVWLVVITMINAAVSAAYYLRIVATMFLRPEPPRFGMTSAERASMEEAAAFGAVEGGRVAFPTTVALVVATAATVGLGTVLPAAQILASKAQDAVSVDQRAEPADPAARESGATTPAQERGTSGRSADAR
jgi:NADH-quinone oxidoreductase subunit N